MNYEEQSDFEINKAVAVALYPAYNWKGVPSHVDRGHSNSVIAYDDEGNRHDEGYIYDFCNLPSDAWPIIVENRIATDWAYEGTWKAVITNQCRPGPFRRFETFNTNPLRAAMIVFLKMQEKEQ
jgi:hypothetical protein